MPLFERQKKICTKNFRAKTLSQFCELVELFVISSSSRIVGTLYKGPHKTGRYFTEEEKMYTRKISRAYVRLESPAERSFRRLPKHVQASYIHQAQSMGADPISVYLQSCTPTLDSSASSAVSYVQNLENGIMEVRHAPEEGAEMARERIRRRVVINGKQQWITGLTEQEYAENLFDAMSGNAKAASAQKHNFQ